MKQTIPLTSEWSVWRPCSAFALAILLLAFSAASLAAKGGIPGPPTGGETSNNLSSPSIQTESASANSIIANWSVPTAPELGVHYSYGCAAPQSDGQFSYPNTSCVDNLSEPTVYYTAEQCQAVAAPCDGQDVFRIYWQKVDVNEWWADDEGISDLDPNFAVVDHIDWGDALEAVSWNERSVIRVETQPWSSTIEDFVPEAGCTDLALCKTGFQMWHVSGQGITEHWGVRATDLDDAVSFNYSSPFQIIKTTKARLSLTKLEEGDALCSQPGGNPGDDPPEILPEAWDEATGGWGDGTCTWRDDIYSVETSVGGKYVYGYNWRMRDVTLDTSCPGFVKTGFWRLTFYVPGGEDVVFDDATIPNVAPPALPASERTLPITELSVAAAPMATVSAESDEDPEEDDRLYAPVVDTTNNLTYIDICVVGKTNSGNGGGGGGGIGGGNGGGRDGSGGIGGGTGGGRDVGGGGSKGGGRH